MFDRNWNFLFSLLFACCFPKELSVDMQLTRMKQSPLLSTFSRQTQSYTYSLLIGSWLCTVLSDSRPSSEVQTFNCSCFCPEFILRKPKADQTAWFVCHLLDKHMRKLSLSIYLSIYLSLSISIYLSIYLSTYLYLSIHLSLSLSISRSLYNNHVLL